MTTELTTLTEYKSASQRFRVAYQNYKEYRETVILETKNMYDALIADGYRSTDAIYKIAEDHKDLRGFSKSTVYNHLPQEVKRVTKPKKALEEKIPENHENWNLPEDASKGMGAVITDDDVIPPIPKEADTIVPPPMETQSSPSDEKQEYEELLKDKDRAIDELRAENKTLKTRAEVPNLDARMQIQKVQDEMKKLIEENTILRKNQPKPELQKASEILQEPLVKPFIIKQQEVSKFVTILNKASTYKTDVQGYLCEGKKLVIQPPLESTGYVTDLAKDDLQYLQDLLAQQRNAAPEN